jgi:hypothetical protein
MRRIIRLLFAVLAAIFVSWATTAMAASHREAPQIANDPTADLTDVYFFRSWEDPTKVILIMNVIPAQEPSGGPNYFNFGDDVRYSFHLDTHGDGDADDIVEALWNAGVPVGKVIQLQSSLWRRVQTGNVQHYALTFLGGVILVIGYFLLH